MAQNFKLDMDGDGIALITWDMPGRSMNVIDLSVIAELSDLVEKLAADEKEKGVVITSGKDTFCAGADLTLLNTMQATFKEYVRTQGEEAAVLHADRLRRRPGPLRAHADENAAGVGAGVAQRAARDLDREAAGGHRLVRAVGRRGWAQLDAAQRHVQLIRRDLGENGQYPLTQLHLARRDRHPPVRVDGQPPRQAPVEVQAARQARAPVVR